MLGSTDTLPLACQYVYQEHWALSAHLTLLSWS